MIFTIPGGSFCITLLQSISLDWEINILYIFIYKIFLNNGQNVPLYIELQWYSYFCHLSDWSIFYQFFLQISNMGCLCIFRHNIWGSQRITFLLYFDFDLQNHPPFAICRSLGKKKHMLMSINNPSSTTLILYYSKIIIICHHVVKKSSTRIEAYSKSNIFPCFFGEAK